MQPPPEDINAFCREISNVYTWYTCRPMVELMFVVYLRGRCLGAWSDYCTPTTRLTARMRAPVSKRSGIAVHVYYATVPDKVHGFTV